MLRLTSTDVNGPAYWLGSAPTENWGCARRWKGEEKEEERKKGKKRGGETFQVLPIIVLSDIRAMRTVMMSAKGAPHP